MAAQEARREKRARRKNLRLVEPNGEQPADAVPEAAGDSPEAEPVREVAPTQKLIDAELRRMSREARQHPDANPRAARQARNATREDAPVGDEPEAGDEIELGEVQVTAEAETDAAESTAVQPTGKAARRRAATADKARRRNSSAVSEENLVLVRQLSLTSQQLNAAHRVIGRLSAERDILRQHFADAVGIPVEEVIVATETNPAEAAQKKAHVEAKPPSKLEKLNYFGGSDYRRMRRRRQTFVVILFGFVLVLWALSRAGYWSMPSNLSRDSLGEIPYVGELMTYFLAGWLFFRVAKVSSKGVRWVFPSENRRRRR